MITSERRHWLTRGKGLACCLAMLWAMSCIPGRVAAAVSSQALFGSVAYRVEALNGLSIDASPLSASSARLYVDGAAASSAVLMGYEADAGALVAISDASLTTSLYHVGATSTVALDGQGGWFGGAGGTAGALVAAPDWASYQAYVSASFASFSVAAQTMVTIDVPFTLSVAAPSSVLDYAAADVALTLTSEGPTWADSVYLTEFASLSSLAQAHQTLSGVLRVSFANTAQTARTARLVIEASAQGYATAVPEAGSLALVLTGWLTVLVLVRLRRAGWLLTVLCLTWVAPAGAQGQISCAAVTSAACSTAKALGRGVNFGNMLDAPQEGMWGVSVRPAYIDVATQAFQTIRLPVRWSNHAAPTIDGKLDEVFARRVDEVVDALLARGVFVILDFHHHMQIHGAALHAGEFAVDESVLDARFVNIWRQVAARYRTRSPKLLFEILNEPAGRLTPARWNMLASRVLSVIRQTNPSRVVMIDVARPARDVEYSGLVMPADRNLIMAAHSYEPVSFTHQYGSAPKIGCCTQDQQSAIRVELDRMVAWSQRTGYPVHLGEFGSYQSAPLEGRAAYARFVRDEAELRGMSWAYWEFASTFGVYPATLNDWLLPLKDALLN